MSDVIKEFLVGIGWKVNEADQKKFVNAVDTATKTVLALEAAIVAAAAAAVTAALKMASSFEDLYYASQRTNASIQNLKGLSYGVSQLGGSFSGALASVEAFGKNIRTNPGYEGMARGLGVATRQNGKLRDTVDILTDLGAVFAKQNYSIGYQYAQAFGLDEATFRALRDQPEALKKYREEYERTARAVGLNLKDAGERSKDLMQSLRSLELTVGVVAEKLLTDLGPAIKRVVDGLNEWIKANPDKIAAFMQQAGEAAIALAGGFKKVVDFITPLATGFAHIASSLTGKDGLQASMELFAIWLTTVWLTKILGAFTGIGIGWSALLLRLGIPAAIGAVALGHGFQTPEQAAANPEQAETNREANGRVASIKRAWRQRPTWLGGTGGVEHSARERLGTSKRGNSTFREKAPAVMARLMSDFDLTKEEAAIVLGNLGHESAGFTAFKEGGNGPGRGWAQWTDPKRKKGFFDYAASRGLDPTSDEANYGYLKQELETTHRSSIARLKAAKDRDSKMVAFEASFEGAGVKAYGSRMGYADAAEKAYDQSQRRSQTAPAPSLGAYDFGRSPIGMGGGVALGTTSNDNSTSSVVTLQQKTEINVNGSADPSAVAGAVAGHQDKINSLSLRNAQGAVR